jgi:hypothetical protein
MAAAAAADPPSPERGVGVSALCHLVDSEAVLRDPAFLLSPSVSTNSAHDVARVVCSVCMLILKDPANIPCGHTACRGCLALGKCVQCMAILPAPIPVNYELQHAQAQLLRRCPHKECTDPSAMSLTMEAMKSHMVFACRFAAVECTACKAHLPRSDLEEHLQKTCSQRRLKCDTCDEFFTGADFMRHRRTSAIPTRHDAKVLDSVRNKRQRTMDQEEQDKICIKQENVDESTTTAGATAAAAAAAADSSVSRGCNNMLVCADECINASTGLPWMFHKSKYSDHRHLTCQVAVHHCDCCCAITPSWSFANFVFPARCHSHLFTGYEAFHAHLREQAVEHASRQQRLMRHLFVELDAAKKKLASSMYDLVGEVLPVETFPARPHWVIDLSSIRARWTTDISTSLMLRPHLHVMTIVRTAHSDQISIYVQRPVNTPVVAVAAAAAAAAAAVATTVTTVSAMNLHLAVLLPFPPGGSSSSNNNNSSSSLSLLPFDTARGARFPVRPISSSHKYGELVWTGEWQKLAVWLTDKYKLCLAKLSAISAMTADPVADSTSHKRSHDQMAGAFHHD